MNSVTASGTTNGATGPIIDSTCFCTASTIVSQSSCSLLGRPLVARRAM